MKKRIPSLILALCVTLCTVPAGAYNIGKPGSLPPISMGSDHSAAVRADGSLWTWGRSEDGEPGSGTKENSAILFSGAASSDFTIENGILSAYSGKGGSVTIPDGVESIGNYAFSVCTSLTGVTIPGTVKSIGEGAFEGCSSLTGVTIPGTVKSIGNYAFFDCTSLTGVTIPDSVKSIGDGAFKNCENLAGITIPDGVTNIAPYTFSYCESLTGITIPDGVKSIGDGAFENCENLTGITIPDGVTNIAPYTFFGCNSLTGITIPDSVKSIGDKAFSCCFSLTGVTIPNGVTNIAPSTFSACNSLTDVTIPGTVKSIGDSAFESCYSLTDVAISDGVESIGAFAFLSCVSLTGVAIPDSVKSIGDGAFLSCKNLTIHGTAGSYAETYAAKEELRFLDDADYKALADEAAARFTDVSAGSSFAAPIAWAVNAGITTGTSKTTFSPGNTCTHKNILTFIWRSGHQAEATGTAADAESALSWAEANGMAQNVDGGAPCTRAQAVTYLWKMVGSPAELETASFSQLTDVPEDCAQAVAWAVMAGITKGTSATTFSPDKTCTRGQIVTFLYRSLAA